MKSYRFRLDLSWHHFAHYYRGDASRVEVIADGGQRLLIHARHFRSLLSSNGLHGHFQLTLTETNEVHSLLRLTTS
ncbi:DUF2835 family protein [Ferrimonas senticii]|uniref:DUF2835 family protein n=1 Tax=Ferrimonas senticii TaxID=394566 RepID=UPI000414D433|nr:DUF2835 family protein [Ferrimonas senticii]